MRTCVAIRHVAFEDLGLLEGLLSVRGFMTRYADAGVDDLGAIEPAAADLMVVLGGPIGVYETEKYPFLVDELDLVERRLATGRPLLGICLGAQLIAKAAGVPVYPGTAKEIGYAPLALTAAGRESPLAKLSAAQFNVLHWHGDTFDLPPGARRLASTDITLNQAFDIGPDVLGLQFHVEVEPEKLERWLIGHTVELAAAGLDPRELRRQATAIAEKVADAGASVLADWLDRAID